MASKLHINTTETSSDAPFTFVQIETPKSTALQPLHISWHNVSVGSDAPTKPQRSTEDETSVRPWILNDVSGEAMPGELLAIMGPSRVATSALLTAIAGQTPPSEMTGSVLINGEPSSASRSTVAFVPHETPMYSTLTVEEQLTLQARLRLGGEANAYEVATRVAEVMAEMNLTTVAQSLTGNGTSGQDLFARDRKLLPIAMELLTDPSVLLVEDPIDELSHFDADAVVKRLQSLARKGRTVIMTSSLENATSAMFGLIDKIYLMTSLKEEGGEASASCGYTVFHGKPVASLTFFETLGHTCPPLTNPFEFFAHQLAVGEDPKDVVRVTQFVHAWSAVLRHRGLSTHAMLPTQEVAMLDSTAVGSSSTCTSVGTQLCVLLRRFVLCVSHDTAAVKGRVRQCMIIAIAFGLLFLRLDITQTHVQPLTTACFFIAASQFSSNVIPELMHAPKEVAIALHDHKNRLYHAMNWYLVKNVSELPFQVVYPLLFLTPAYFLMGFPADIHVFFTFYLFTCLLASTAVSFGLFAASVAPTHKKAVLVAVALIVPAVVFGGAFMNHKTTPIYFLWLQQLSPIKYCYHGLMRAFWNHVHTIDCPPNTLCRATSGQSVLAMNYIHNDKMVSDVLIMVAINLALRVLGGFALWRRAAALTAPRK